MPAVLDQLADSGMEFTQAFVTTPACAPSRASIMTGQYAHNHRVLRNGRPYGAPAFDDSSNLATWLRNAGYRTGFFGKYLNRYTKMWEAWVERPYVPPGWDDWRAFDSNGDGSYFDYSMVENGWVVAYGDDEEDYSTDVISGHALGFIDAVAREGRRFFIAYNPSAPHFPYTAAPRHVGMFSSLLPWTPPNMLEPDVSDKLAWVRGLPFTLESFLRAMRIRTRQLTMLQAVDEFVDDLMEKLREYGIENDTLVVFTSDNGMAWGEHRYIGKACGYEECLRVPLLVRYPRLVPLARQSSSVVLNVDLAPTLAELAGAPPPPGSDGRSLVRVLDGTDREPRDAFFFEAFAWPKLYFAGVREAGWKYVEYQYGEQELYDLVSDPYELENIAHAPESAERLARMQLRLLEFEPDWSYMP
jgi:arylsulfatase A-like enzyme